MPVTQASTLSSQFQTYFSKSLLKQVKQLTILDQFARKEPVPKNAGALGNAQKLRIQRYGPPSIAGVKSATEGTALATSDYRQLSLISLEKGVNQYQQVIGLTDILQMTALFNTLEQAQKTQAADIALWVDTIMRNVLIGSNLTASGASLGAGIESPIDNSDAINNATGAATPGIKMYGNPGSGLTQDMTSLNTSTNTAQVHLDSSGVLDAVTRLRLNRAPLINGRYVMVTDPRIARDLQRDTQWLAASNYGNQGKPFYNGEVGEIAGCKVVTQTNSFVCRGTAEFVYSNPTGGGTAAGTDIIASFFLGDEAFGIPYLTGDDPMSPRMYIVDTPDKSDPTNQLTTVGVKLFFQALRLAAGNTASSGNPVWYIVHRSKTASQG